MRFIGANCKCTLTLNWRRRSMKKDRKKEKSLSKSRSRRKFQGDKLEKRVKTGQDRRQSLSKNILKTEVDAPMYRPKDGQHILDVVPYMAGEHDPLCEDGDPTYSFEYWAHTNVGQNNAMLLCPMEMYGDPCYICDHRERLRQKGADEEKWKPLYPKRRNLYNILCYDRGEEKKGIQIWDVSYHYFEKFILAISKKPSRQGKKSKTINFAHPKKGKSITFTIEPPKSKNDYPTFLGHTFDDRDYKISQDTLAEAFVLDEIVHIPDEDEIKRTFLGKKGKGDDSSSSGGGEDNEELDELKEELEDIGDYDDFKDFIEEHDLDIKIKKKMDEDDIRDKVVEALEEKFEEGEGEGGDDDKHTVDDIRDMKKKGLLKLIDEEDLDVDPDDADDTEELQDLIIEEMELEED